MEALIKTGRTFYALCIVNIGINQIFWADFRTVVLPAWPMLRTSVEIWAYVVGAILIGAGIAIIFYKRAKEIALVLGSIFLVLFIFIHVPYLLFIQPHQIYNLGLWADAGKTLALSGGAFVVAASFYHSQTGTANTSTILTSLEKLIPLGPIFFSITMITFGIDHFLYVDFVAPLVPSWIPWPIFWTYFAGVALISSGVAIIFKIRIKEVALLLGVMIFLWFIFLHVPRAIADPYAVKGNEVLSAGDALAFSGTAFIIAFWKNLVKKLS
jgi:uncharacterized membrane protein